MKKKQKRTVVSGPWDIAALVLAGLLALDLLCMLVLLLAGAQMRSHLECGMVLGVHGGSRAGGLAVNHGQIGLGFVLADAAVNSPGHKALGHRNAAFYHLHGKPLRF